MTTTITKQISTPKQIKTDWKKFTRFTITKIAENVYDMILTIVTLGMTLSYLFLTVPEMAVEYSGYIIVAFVLILVRRIVQDFDENYTLDEIGKQNEIIIEYLQDLHRIQRAESNVDDGQLEVRLRALE